MRTDGGQKAFSIPLFQGRNAIPILASLPLLGGGIDAAHPHAPQDLMAEAFKIVAVVGAIVLGGVGCCGCCCAAWIARSKTPEIFTATSLFLVVGIATLDAVGGPFHGAGCLPGRRVLLADSEYRRELETDRALQGPAAGSVLHRRA